MFREIVIQLDALGFDRFLQSKGEDPDTFFLGMGLVDKDGKFFLVEPAPEASFLISEFMSHLKVVRVENPFELGAGYG